MDKANRSSHLKNAFILLLALMFLGASEARAGFWESSAGFSYTRSNYTGTNYSWSKRWGLSLGYNFTEISQVEAGFQHVTDRNYIEGYEDTTFYDRIYSLSLVQSLLPKSSPVQPFVKAGIGQLNRETTGTYAGGVSPPKRVDSITGIIGVGCRLYFTREFAFRSEATSYLQGGKISKWKDNISVTLGLSLLF